MQMFIRIILLFLFLASSLLAYAAETDLVLDTAERYVRLQSQGMSGQVKITMGKLDVSRLPPVARTKLSRHRGPD